MAIFDDLLAIKRFREGKAEVALRKQRLALAAATRRREQAQWRLLQFQDQARREELALYEDLCRRIVLLRDIQDVQATVSAMREQERDHTRTVDAAVDGETREQDGLQACRQAHAEAMRVKEKFLELARNHALERWQSLERREDAELEEAAQLSRDRRDWDVHGESEGASP